MADRRKVKLPYITKTSQDCVNPDVINSTIDRAGVDKGELIINGKSGEECLILKNGFDQYVTVDGSNIVDKKIADNILEVTTKIEEIETDITEIKDNISSIDQRVSGLSDGLAEEIAARISGDTVLSGRIDEEITARISGDTALSGRIDEEITARISGDTALSGRIDTLTSALADEVSARTSGDATLRGLITEVSGNVETLSGHVNHLYEITDDLKERDDELSGHVETLSGHVITLYEQDEALSGHISTLSGFVINKADIFEGNAVCGATPYISGHTLWIPTVGGSRGEKGDKGDTGSISAITVQVLSGVTPSGTAVVTGNPSNAIIDFKFYGLESETWTPQVDGDGELTWISSKSQDNDISAGTIWGKSAYQIAVDTNSTTATTESDWIASLKGNKGDKGDAGKIVGVSATTTATTDGNVDVKVVSGGTQSELELGFEFINIKGDAGKIVGVSATTATTTGGTVNVEVATGGTQNELELGFNFINIKGDKGDKGDTGAQGEKGDKGDTGATGAQGEKGDDGKSAYEIATDNGFEGTELEWLASLKGKDGRDGADGADGQDGAPGQPGQDGADGANGQDGESAYALAKRLSGNSQSFPDESAWIASLKGAPAVINRITSSAKTNTDSTATTISASTTTSEGGYNIHFDFVNIKGEKGDKGDEGKSAYQVAKDLSNNPNDFPSAVDWIASLKGDTGKIVKVSATTATTTDGPVNVEVATGGTQNELELGFNFINIKGDAGKIVGVSATTSADTENTTTRVIVANSGTTTDAELAFKFINIKGDKGDKGKSIVGVTASGTSGGSIGVTVASATTENGDITLDFGFTGLGTKDIATGEGGGLYFMPHISTTEGSGDVMLSWVASETVEGVDLPAAVNIRGPQGPKGDAFTYDDFNEEQKNLLKGDSPYVLDLSNDSASINCDKDEKPLSGSVKYLTCKAQLYHGSSAITDCYYSATTKAGTIVSGFSINSATGEFTFSETGFNFNTLSTEIEVKAYSGTSDVELGTKIMTISKNPPGPNGEPAVRKEIKLSTTNIVYNYKTRKFTPSAVTATIWKQVGGDDPIVCNDQLGNFAYVISGETEINYEYTGNFTGTTTVDLMKVSGNEGNKEHVGVAFALPPVSGTRYEEEVIYFSYDGKDGTDGTNGRDGTDGVSNWYIELSNDNATINCYNDGRLMERAIKPESEVKIFYGASDVTHQFSGLTSASVSISSNAVIDGRVVSAGDLDDTVLGHVLTNDNNTIKITTTNISGWTDDSLNITVSFTISGGAKISKTMSILKNFSGISRWIELSTDTVKYNPNTGNYTPSAITAQVWKQEGNNSEEIDNETHFYRSLDNKFNPCDGHQGPLELILSGVTGLDVDTNPFIYFGLSSSTFTPPWYEVETLKVIKDGKDGKDATSPVRLSLTNDNASINCNSVGSIPEGAVLPTCTAELYYGTEKVTGATFEFLNSNGYGAEIVEGTGVLDFSRFVFPDGTTAVELKIKGSGTISDISVSAVNTMTISKNMPGPNGEPATNYWININSGSGVVILSSGETPTVTPSAITFTAMKQVGSATPESLSLNGNVGIFYSIVSNGNMGGESRIGTNPVTLYTSGASAGTIDSYVIKLKVGEDVVDSETIPVLRNGLNGKDGVNGLRGATVRGPVDFVDAMSGAHNGTRWWYDGKGSDDETLWLDIVYYNKKYYYCKQSYLATTGSSYPSQDTTHWQEADAQFEFISTKLLLADDAKIKFLTGQEIHLSEGSDTGGTTTVTAGIRGGSGDTVNFWAGGGIPTTAPFRVENNGKLYAENAIIQGTISANTGCFGPAVIGVDGYDVPRLEMSYRRAADSSIPDALNFSAYYGTNRMEIIQKDENENTQSRITIGDPSYTDLTAPLTVTTTHPIGISTNKAVEGNSFINDNGCALAIEGLNMGCRIICNDHNKFGPDSDERYLSWNDIPILYNRNGAYVSYNANDDVFERDGEWVYGKESYSSPLRLGIYTSNHTKAPNKLYITIE